MSDRLPRSNSQSHLPNYGQSQSGDKNTNVGNDKNGVPAQSDKKNGQGRSETGQAKPQMKSKEEKKGREPSESDSDDGKKSANTFEKLFLNGKPSQAESKFREEESSSEDGPMQSQNKMPQSPRQQQPKAQEKNTKKNVSTLSLKNLGNALASLASDRPEMTISPRKTRRETQDTVANAETPRRKNTSSNAARVPATVGTTTEKTTISSPASWTPASPRAINSSNTQSSSVTTATQMGAETKASSAKVEKNTTLATVNENTVSKTAVVKEKVIGSVYADDLSAQSINTINLALSGTIVSGADLAELLVCFQSCGYKKSMQGSDTDSILRLGMTVKDFPDPDNPGKTIDVNIIEKVSEPFIKKYYDTPEMAELRIAAMQKYDEGNLKVPDELKKKNPSNLRDVKTYSDAMRPLVKMVSKKIMGETMNLSVAPMHNQVKELLKGIDACVIKWSKVSGGIDKEKLILARKSAISAYIATRSFMKIWFDVFAKDPALKKYIHMTGYLTTMLTTRSDKFFYSVMSNAVDQDNEQKKLLEESKNAAAFSSLGKQKKITGRQFATPEQRAERRAVKKEVDNFLSNFDESLIDSNFSQYLQTTLASSKENNFSFRKNPTQFVLDNLNDYWFSIDSTDGGDLFVESNTLNTLKQLLGIKIESERADDSGKTTTSTVATNTTTTTNTNPTQASSEEDGSPRKQ